MDGLEDGRLGGRMAGKMGGVADTILPSAVAKTPPNNSLPHATPANH